MADTITAMIDDDLDDDSLAPGVRLTEFHYGGVSVELDPQWSPEWYRERLDAQLEQVERDGDQWGWFWVDQRRGRLFRFRVSSRLAYAFTVTNLGGSTLDGQIQDLATRN